MKDIEKTIKELDSKYQKAVGTREHIKKQALEARIKSKKLLREIKIVTQSGTCLSFASDLMREEVKIKVERLVTEGLRRTINPRDSFYFDMGVKYGRMQAVPMRTTFVCDLERHGTIKEGRGCGGSVADIISFILSIVFITLKHDCPNIYIGDEPFRNVDRDKILLVVEMIKWLRDITKIQFNIVTHKKEFEEIGDKVFLTEKKKDGLSTIREL